MAHKEEQEYHKITRNTRIIAVGNQKGGVGKTTIAVHLAAALGERGRKCLVWDLDVNCGSTRHLGIPDGLNVLGTFEVLTGAESAQEVIVRPGDLDGVTLPKNVELLPAHVKLEGLDRVLAARNSFVASPDLLIAPLESLRGQYDYILLDTAPNLTTPTIAAYKAAAYFLLVTTPESFAIDGLNNAMKYVANAREAGNRALRLMGVVVGKVPGRGTRLSSELLDYVDRTFAGGDAFMQPYKTTINASTVIPSVQKDGRTLFDTDPEHKIAWQFRALASEVEKRFEQLEAATGKEDKSNRVGPAEDVRNG